MKPPYSHEMEELKKCRWSPEEDIILVSYIQEHGDRNWRAVSENTGLQKSGKSGRSCRLRWKNYLRPGIKLGDYSQEEEDIIILHQARLGNRWSKIATYLPQRTDNDIKNYWYTHLKKKVELAKRDNHEVPGASGALADADESIRITPSLENNQAVSSAQQMLNVKLTEKWLLDDNPSAFPFSSFSDSCATTGGFADIGATSGNENEDLFLLNALNPFGGHQGF